MTGQYRLRSPGALQAGLQALHPYELPEIFAVPIVRGSTACLGRLRDALSRNE
jgi:uncharacterized protein involved in tolerance to divalent cations